MCAAARTSSLYNRIVDSAEAHKPVVILGRVVVTLESRPHSVRLSDKAGLGSLPTPDSIQGQLQTHVLGIDIAKDTFTTCLIDGTNRKTGEVPLDAIRDGRKPSTWISPH